MQVLDRRIFAKNFNGDEVAIVRETVKDNAGAIIETLIMKDSNFAFRAERKAGSNKFSPWEIDEDECTHTVNAFGLPDVVADFSGHFRIGDFSMGIMGSSKARELSERLAMAADSADRFNEFMDSSFDEAMEFLS